LEDRDLHPLELTLLSYLDGVGEAWDEEIIEKSGIGGEGSYRRAAQWLISRGLVDEAGASGETRVLLGPLGEECAAAGGTPELLLLDMVEEGTGTSPPSRPTAGSIPPDGEAPSAP